MILCMSNGTWSSGVPVCSRECQFIHIDTTGMRVTSCNVIGAECTILPEINNGFVIDQTRKYYYGDEARVQCHRGFKLTGGPSIIKCGANQTFTNVPKCEGV